MANEQISTIGKYQVLDQLGEGAMGIVYRARDPVLNRFVAVKVMTEALAREPELRDRFLREAQAAGSLQHPNVVTVFDFGEVDGHLYIAMELVDGVDLERILARREPLPLQAKLDVVVDVLTGLSYAHKHGVVHRDIKPANIRITEDGRAKIMDFGVAHLSSSNMTKTGMMMGTPNYMAPEQVTGDRTTPATDIFAVGAVLYELLTGVKPFQGPTLHNILFRIVGDEPTPISQLMPGLPPALERIVMRALAKESASRYQNALDMANDLSAVRAALSDHPKTNTLSLRASLAKEMREAATGGARRRAWKWGATAGGIAAAALVGVAAWRLHEPGRAGTAPPASIPASSPAAPPPGASGNSAMGPAPASANTPIDAAADSTSVRRAPAAADQSPSGDVSGARPPGRSGRADPAGSSDAAAARALSAFRKARVDALNARARAVAAGATATQLASGDEHDRSAAQLVERDRLGDATAQLTAAAALWSEAERAARLAASARPPSAPVTSPPVTVARADSIPSSPRPPVAAPSSSTTTATPKPPPPPPAASSTVVAPTLPPAAPPASSPEEARADISSLIARYALAIESRDTVAVRRANAGLTGQQAKGFADFFASVRSLRAQFTLTSLDLSGTTATARVSGAYDYVSNSGKSERQPVTFSAQLKRDASGWHITGVR